MCNDVDGTRRYAEWNNQRKTIIIQSPWYEEFERQSGGCGGREGKMKQDWIRRGAPGWLSGLKPLPSAQVMITGSWNRGHIGLSAQRGSCFLLSLCLPLCLLLISVCPINKLNLKKKYWIGRETNHKRLLISQNKLRVAGGRGVGRGSWGCGHWGRYVLRWVLGSV